MKTKDKRKPARLMTLEEKIAEYPVITCSVCCETKSRDEFYNFKPSRSGKETRCKSCALICTKAYKSKHYLNSIYYNIKHRCCNSDHKDFPDYGGRGITMYDTWIYDMQSFIDWIITNIGDRPDSTYSLDRINNDKGYIPGNLRWASRTLQNVNQRSSYFSEFNAPDETLYITHNINRFCRKHGLCGSVMNCIINGKYPSTHYKGWTAVKINNPTLEQVRQAEITDDVPAGTYTDSFNPK